MNENVGHEFEREVAAIYRSLGAKVEHNISLAGNQIDILVTEHLTSGLTVKSAIECKAYARPVGIDVINAFGSISNLLRLSGLIDKAVLISLNGFTKQARSAAKQHNIEVIELSDLQQRICTGRIGEVRVAFDSEMQRLKNNQRITGISLSNLARVAIEEEGDFEVAREAFMSLIRLSTARMGEGNIVSLNHPVPIATPLKAAVEVLRRMQKDSELFEDVVYRTRLLALIGDSPFSSLSDYNKIPDKSFEVITSVLYATCLNTNLSANEWAGRRIVEQLSDLLLGIGFVIAKRGVELPEPSSRRYVDRLAERCTGPEQHVDLLPFVRLCNKIASLPQKLFDYVFSRPIYRIAIRDVIVDATEGCERKEAIETIKRWAVIPFYALTPPMQVKTEGLREECVNLIDQTNELGSQVSIKTREYILAERENLSKRRLPSQSS